MRNALNTRPLNWTSRPDSSGTLDVVRQAKSAGVRGREQRTRPIGIPLRDEDLDGTESVECQAVRVSQRLPSLNGRNAGRLEECANLLRLYFTACDVDAAQVWIHSESLMPCGCPCRLPQSTDRKSTRLNSSHIPLSRMP